jgi:transcriptional regulator with XRE-family HTH domain
LIAMTEFPLPGILRRLRRAADCSQRELAAQLGLSKTAVAAVESGTRDLPASALALAAALAGGRLAVVDASGRELTPMAARPVRDAAGRRFPAHLDTRHGDVDWWHGVERYSRRRPQFTFDRDRGRRDWWRQAGTPEDHHLPQPGDDLAARAAVRQQEARRRWAEERRAREAAAGPPAAWVLDWGTGCTCPPGCDYDEETNEDLAHVADCACRCDVS